MTIQESDRRVMQDRRELPEDDTAVRVWMPWLSKWGPVWLAFFALLYYQLFLPHPATKADMQDMTNKVAANAALLSALNSTMNDAARTMHDAALQRQENERAVLYTLTQMCLSLNDGPIGKQSCWNAMRGQPPLVR